tara:strand:+ start:12000 stop:12896 length:897 start_codon:yes stop_codon:yes gene_type:complete
MNTTTTFANYGNRLKLTSLWILIASVLVGLMVSKALATPAPSSEAYNSAANVIPEQYTYRILQTRDHSTKSFTQGLALYQGDLIESSGLYGRSFVSRYHPTHSKPVQKKRLNRRLFAEGVALFNDTLYLLTWKRGVVLQLNPNTLEPRGQLSYQGEGWGLARYEQQLLMSDGSNQLSLRSPQDFSIERQLSVSKMGQPLHKLNDLTVIPASPNSPARIWANVWHHSSLYAIDPNTGTVEAQLDLSALANKHSRGHPDNVLNGIVWDQARQGLWVTGKRWPKRYLIELIAPHSPSPEEH